MMRAVSVQGLKKTYKNGFTALNGIDLNVEEGDFFALLGPNGAGKTTLISILCSLVIKTHGTVSIFGYDIDEDFPTAKTFLGLVPQEFNFSIFQPVEQILVNQAGYYGIPRKVAYQRAEKYLKRLEIWHKRKEPARLLSGGMKRRLMIARALLHEPKLLILDEPTAGVDIEIRRSMWDFLREINQRGTTIILTTHYLEEAESLCRDIAIIDHGDIIENTTMANLLTKLSMESFILYLKSPIEYSPDLSSFPSRLLDNRTLEVDVMAPQTMNDLFQTLGDHEIKVASMKNKANRLEELFVRLTGVV